MRRKKEIKKVPKTFAYWKFLIKKRTKGYLEYIQDFFWSKVYKVEDFFRRCKRLIQWTPVIWNDRDWDYGCAFELTAYKFNRLADAIKTDGHSVDRKKTAKEIKEFVKVLKKLSDPWKYEEKYYNAAYKKYPCKLNSLELVPCKWDAIGEPILYETSPKRKKSGAKRLNMIRRGMEKAEKEIQADIAKLPLLLKNYRSWWD